MRRYLHGCVTAGAVLLALAGGDAALAQKSGGVLKISFFDAGSDDVARSFRDHVARCSDMMSPA